MLPGKTIPIVTWTVRDPDANERRWLHELATVFVPKRHGGTTQLLDEIKRLARS